MNQTHAKNMYHEKLKRWFPKNNLFLHGNLIFLVLVQKNTSSQDKTLQPTTSPNCRFPQYSSSTVCLIIYTYYRVSVPRTSYQTQYKMAPQLFGCSRNCYIPQHNHLPLQVWWIFSLLLCCYLYQHMSNYKEILLIHTWEKRFFMG